MSHTMTTRVISNKFNSIIIEGIPDSPSTSSSIVIIEDKVWGQIELNGNKDDKILIALLNSPTVQRLKTVLQHGISSLYGKCNKTKVTRYEHSVGAMILVRKLGGTIEAQASALLHDIAHTSLSHVVDNAFGCVVHEVEKMTFLRTTEIPSLIESHNFSSTRVLNEELFPLLEQDAPALCADRVDYGLRDSLAFGTLSLRDALFIAGDLREFEGKIICSTKESAVILSEAYLASDKYAWSNPSHAALYRYAAKAIKEANVLGILPLSQLWSSPSDEVFWQSLVNSTEPTVRELASKVRSNLRARELKEGESEEGKEILRMKLKVRVLDPPIAIYGESGKIVGVEKLSEIDLDYRERIEEYRKSKEGERTFVISDEE